MIADPHVVGDSRLGVRYMHGRQPERSDLTTWPDHSEYRADNWCNTGWGWQFGVDIICSRGGIGCNVDHDAVDALNVA